MSLDVPALPNSITHSSNSFSDLREAEAAGRKGEGVLTPYLNFERLKHFKVKVDGYDDEPILDLDTAKLFLGTLLDPGSGTEGGTYPYAGGEGELGGPTLAWPLRLQRVHFFASEGRPEDLTSSISEYYSYFLCGQPIRVNGIGTDDSNLCTSDETEETLGVKKSWNSSYDENGIYNSRTIIGNPGRTGSVVTEVYLVNGQDTNSCYVDLVVNKGIAFLLKTGGSYETYRVGYSAAAINAGFNTICSELQDLGTVFDELNTCLADIYNTGTGSGSWPCDPASVCTYIDSMVECFSQININIDCDDLIYCP